MAAVNVTFPGNLAQVKTANDLRSVPSTLLPLGALFLVNGLEGLFEYDPGSLAADDGKDVLRPYDKTPGQVGRWLRNVDGLATGPEGPPGPANSTYTTLAGLKAAAVSNASYIFAPPSGSDGGAAAGTFLYQTAGAPYTADGVNVIKLDAVPLSTGALVRQAATGINLDGRNVQEKLFETVSITDARFAGGAKVSRADNTDQIQAAIDAVAAAGGGAVEVPLGKFDIARAIYLRERVRLTGKGFGSRLHSTNTNRLDAVRAFGPTTGDRMAGVCVDNLRLTSTFAATGSIGGNGIPTGSAIAFERCRDSTITNVWTHNWSDGGVAITDCTRVRGSNVNIREVSQGYNVFNDSHDCSLDGLICDIVVTYVGLNIEGLANGSSFRPTGFVGSNIVVTNFVTHGINLVNAVRPVVTSWACSGGTGGPEGPGNGIEAYGCEDCVIGSGMASNNAGWGVIIGPSQNDSILTGIRTSDNGLGGLLLTDGPGIGVAVRTAVSGCAFGEGPPKLEGNVSILNTVQQQTIEANLPIVRLIATAEGKRNAQTIYSSKRDTDQTRVGIDITTNNGTQIFQVYMDSYGNQIFGVDANSITGANDGASSLGRADQRFSQVFAANGTINTSDRRHKQQIDQVPGEWLDAWGDVEWCRFKFNDAVAAKGDAARWHIGLIAQQIVSAFEARGLDATEIGLICYDKWDAVAPRDEERDPEGNVTVPASSGREAGDLWSVRMTECLALDAAYQRREIQRLHDAQTDANRSGE